MEILQLLQPKEVVAKFCRYIDRTLLIIQPKLILYSVLPESDFVCNFCCNYSKRLLCFQIEQLWLFSFTIVIGMFVSTVCLFLIFLDFLRLFRKLYTQAHNLLDFCQLSDLRISNRIWKVSFIKDWLKQNYMNQ